MGAIDGKHVVIQAPNNTGSQHRNYKGTDSIVLLALCDAAYRFTMVDIGECCSWSDGGIFKACQTGKRLNAGTLNLPPPKEITSTTRQMAFVIVADAAFPLKENLMKPYGVSSGSQLPRRERIFNYRLSRARRVIENAFGILVIRWRILRQQIHASLDTIDSMVWAVVCLHNFLMHNGSGQPFSEYSVVLSEHDTDAGATRNTASRAN